MTGCDTIAAQSPAQISALPLIEQEIARQVPLFDDKWQKNVMDQVCALASGNISKREFDDFFIKRGVDVQLLATKDSGFYFIANIDQQKAEVSCSAFIISSIITPLSVYGDRLNDDGLYQQQMQILTPLIAKTTEFLAEIAHATTTGSVSSIKQYQDVVNHYFVSHAAQFIDATLKKDFNSKDYLRPSSTTSIYNYTLQNGISNITFYGENWLSNGYIMGKKYMVNLSSN